MNSAKQWLGELGFDPSYGARPLKRTIQREVETPIAKAILGGKYPPGDTFYQCTLSMYPVNVPCQCILSMYFINVPCQCTLSMHSINAPCHISYQHFLSTHLNNTPHQRTLLKPFYQHTLSTHPINIPSHPNIPFHPNPPLILTSPLLLTPIQTHNSTGATILIDARP